MANWTAWCILAVALLVPRAAATSGDAQGQPGVFRLAAEKTSPPIPPLLLPATGYWYDAERPGTGFALQRRGPTLALVFYHFTDAEEPGHRVSDWHLASGPLQGDVFEADLLHFDGGSCLGCDPFVAANAGQTDTVVRLEFSTAREATLQIDEGAPRRVVAMPFGVAYQPMPGAAADLPLPDLRGRWMLEHGPTPGIFILEERTAVEDGVEYHGRAVGLGLPNARMRCTGADCVLSVDDLPLGSEEEFVAQFRPGDITEERMSGSDSLTIPLQAFRLNDAQGQP